jgi:hypothetical protein
LAASGGGLRDLLWAREGSRLGRGDEGRDSGDGDLGNMVHGGARREAQEVKDGALIQWELVYEEN